MAPHVLMFKSKVHRPMYTINSRKYMDIKLERSIAEKVQEIQSSERVSLGSNPLNDDVLVVKVPWRYKKVDCDIIGITPVQEMKEGDDIWSGIEYCGLWATGHHWKFATIGVV